MGTNDHGKFLRKLIARAVVGAGTLCYLLFPSFQTSMSALTILSKLAYITFKIY